MPAEGFWGGWVGFAGVFMLIMGTVELCEGLIAILRDRYYAQSPQQIVVFDLKTWGWITLIWGIVVGLTGLGLLARQGWALGRDRRRQPELHRPARVRRLAPVPALGARRARAERRGLYALIVRWEEATASPL